MDNPDAEGGSRFAERFLTSGGVPLTPEGLLERRENLAVILLGLVMGLLTGRLPADRFIPLMDAAKAYEAIKVARAEGEIAGRNAVIEEQLVAPPVGAPDLAGTPIARSRRSATSIFDLAEMAR
ncbi:MAG: hypothetical protein K2I37_00490 [Muribaculaceae bacterium]|nr:hypothetical protein [Muribaculaceae bacterium]